MPRPKLLAVSCSAMAAMVVDAWRSEVEGARGDIARAARARLKSLETFQARAMANPLAAGDRVAHDRWPRSLARDYGSDIGNLFRFQLADRWRGYYTLVGEDDGARIWILYLWDHERYSRESGYAKK